MLQYRIEKSLIKSGLQLLHTSPVGGLDYAEQESGSVNPATVSLLRKMVLIPTGLRVIPEPPKDKEQAVCSAPYGAFFVAVFLSLICFILRQYRTKIACGLRRQIFRQIV